VVAAVSAALLAPGLTQAKYAAGATGGSSARVAKWWPFHEIAEHKEFAAPKPAFNPLADTDDSAITVCYAAGQSVQTISPTADFNRIGQRQRGINAFLGHINSFILEVA
jgi:hypothetical protein